MLREFLLDMIMLYLYAGFYRVRIIIPYKSNCVSNYYGNLAVTLKTMKKVKTNGLCCWRKFLSCKMMEKVFWVNYLQRKYIKFSFLHYGAVAVSFLVAFC